MRPLTPMIVVLSILVGFSTVEVGKAAEGAGTPEVTVQRAFFDGQLATALVIVHNEDRPAGYDSLRIECVFSRGGERVATSSAEIRELSYRQRTAVRLSTPITEGFDNAECHALPNRF